MTSNNRKSISIDTNGIVGIYQYDWLDSMLNVFQFKQFCNVATYNAANNLASITATGEKNITNNIASLSIGKVVGTIINVDTTNGEYLSQSFYNDITRRYQVGAWHQPQFIDSYYTELSIFNLQTQADQAKFRLSTEASGLPYAFLHLDDSTITVRNIFYRNTSVLPDSAAWSLGTVNKIWRSVATNAFIMPTNAANGKVLTSNANGNATWSTASTTEADSVTIYALTPANGTQYYCTDCSGNGITGRIVAYIASAWRRLTFED